MTEKTRYQAPALKKGLEIIELLAAASEPLIMSDISAALGRSVSEIFRMLQVLEEHGYIARAEDGYRLTNRLFALGMSQPPVRDLASTALPVMQELARKAGQSCHLGVASGAEMVVIIAIEAPGLSGFAVRVGYRRPLHRSNSGRILLAFQPPESRAPHQCQYLRHAAPETPPYTMAWRWPTDPFLHNRLAARMCMLGTSVAVVPKNLAKIPKDEDLTRFMEGLSNTGLGILLSHIAPVTTLHQTRRGQEGLHQA